MTSASRPGADPRTAVAEPSPAATVVLLRPTQGGPEVLLTRRPSTMAFGPDIHVFPGGRVDRADRAPAALRSAGIDPDEAGRRLGLGLAPDPGMTPEIALAHHVAAVRETLEETGIRIEARDLIALTRWVTPISMPRRFDVRFFAAFVPTGTEISATSPEVVAAAWMHPHQAFERWADKEIDIWQPTFVTLQQLDGLASVDEVRAAFAPGTGAGGPTLSAEGPGITRVDAAWAGGIPGRRATGWLIGKHEVVCVDPADPTDVTTEAIVAAVAEQGGRLAGVLVTSLDPASHAGVEMLTHGLGLPVATPEALARSVPYPAIGLEPDARVPFGDVPITLDAVAAWPSPRTRVG